MHVRFLCLFMNLNTSPHRTLSRLTPFLPIHRLTRPQRCPHYGPLQEPPQCPSRAEWHSIAMEKLSRLCDWLLVNKELSAVWGLWGANYQRERGRLTMTGSEKGLQRREKEKKQKVREREQAKARHCKTQAIRKIS